MAQTGAVASHFGLDNQGIRTGGTEFWNLSVPELYEQALQRNEARLAHGGPLVAVTGEHTGRSPDDKFIVRDAETEDAVDWGAVNKPIDRAAFDRLRDRIADYLSSRDLFVQDCFAGADPDYRLRVRVITECAWHSLFARNMFIRPPADALRGFEPEFTVLQAPSVLAEPEADGTNSSTFILVDFSQRIIVIGGSEYARRDQEIGLLDPQLPAAETERLAHALFRQYRRARRCLDLLRPVRHRQDDPVGRSVAHADRRRRAWLVVQRRVSTSKAAATPR